MYTLWARLSVDIIDWNVVYRFINSIKDNRMKQFKYKTLNYIFPTKVLRHTWKIWSCLLIV